MNLAAGILKRWLRPPRWAVARAPRQLPATVPPRKNARSALAWFAAAALLINVVVFAILETNASHFRDLEYGKRIISLRQRQAEYPDRPLVLVIGSSRASMGVRPAAWEECRPNLPGHPDPLIFNMSLVGSGPVMELMSLRRAYADGIRPDAVVLEYWPPFLREDGPYFEPERIDHARLGEHDRPLVRDYFYRPDNIERQMFLDRLEPLYRNRHRLMAELLPRWQPWDKRIEMGWANLDGWGWLSGLEEHYPPDPKMRAIRLKHCEPTYAAQFKDYRIDDVAVRALRESVALARSHGAKVAFVYFPEASEFRGWMPASVERTARDRLAELQRELKVPLIDARLWMPDGYMVDGFHLSRIGAWEFTKRFGPAVAAAFPDLARRP